MIQLAYMKELDMIILIGDIVYQNSYPNNSLHTWMSQKVSKWLVNGL